MRGEGTVDASRMSEEKRQAMEVAEEAREQQWAHPSFVGQLFMGHFLPDLIFPYPEQSDDDRRIGDEYLATLETFLRQHLDPDAVDRQREVPQDVIQGLFALGAFGMNIPKEYGGLGLSKMNYSRAIALVASFCGSTAVWLSAHQSIGVPQPLKLFGTEEQKKKYLPRLATHAISGFALTEPEVGSDPAKMSTTATPTSDGRDYLLNGEKLWCTNGPKAELLIVMAQTPPKVVGGKERKQITAFIVETSSPGFSVVHRCDFMGIRGIQNGLLRFHDLKVPKDNILWEEGRGLKIALTTLNAGRLSLPAACIGVAKQCLTIARYWGKKRVQWGLPIGHHEAGASKVATMAATLFAMEAVTWLTTAMADRGQTDIRLEAAMAKLFCSEVSWRIVDDTVQLCGGRGYETAESQRQRGELPFPVERLLRDSRINLIIEGTSEIMRLFLAREALDPHMRLAQEFLQPSAPLGARVRAVFRMARFYLTWYPQQWIYTCRRSRRIPLGKPLSTHLRYVEGTSHRLARAIVHAMGYYQTALEQRQLVLSRLVEIGTDLFAMAASCSRAQRLLHQRPDDRTPTGLADLYCKGARRRIEAWFRALSDNDDRQMNTVARQVLDGRMVWLEDDIISAIESAQE